MASPERLLQDEKQQDIDGEMAVAVAPLKKSDKSGYHVELAPSKSNPHQADRRDSTASLRLHYEKIIERSDLKYNRQRRFCCSMTPGQMIVVIVLTLLIMTSVFWGVFGFVKSSPLDDGSDMTIVKDIQLFFGGFSLSKPTFEESDDPSVRMTADSDACSLFLKYSGDHPAPVFVNSSNISISVHDTHVGNFSTPDILITMLTGDEVVAFRLLSRLYISDFDAYSLFSRELFIHDSVRLKASGTVTFVSEGQQNNVSLNNIIRIDVFGNFSDFNVSDIYLDVLDGKTPSLTLSAQLFNPSQVSLSDMGNTDFQILFGEHEIISRVQIHALSFTVGFNTFIFGDTLNENLEGQNAFFQSLWQNQQTEIVAKGLNSTEPFYNGLVQDITLTMTHTPDVDNLLISSIVFISPLDQDMILSLMAGDSADIDIDIYFNNALTNSITISEYLFSVSIGEASSTGQSLDVNPLQGNTFGIATIHERNVSHEIQPLQQNQTRATLQITADSKANPLVADALTAAFISKSLVGLKFDGNFKFSTIPETKVWNPLFQATSLGFPCNFDPDNDASLLDSVSPPINLPSC